MVKSKYRGHDIELKNSIWIYCDTKNPVKTQENRNCKKCDQLRTKEGHDPCLGALKHTMNACCGHGKIAEAYIQLYNGFRISGIFALIAARLLKHN